METEVLSYDNDAGHVGTFVYARWLLYDIGLRCSDIQWVLRCKTTCCLSSRNITPRASDESGPASELE